MGPGPAEGRGCVSQVVARREETGQQSAGPAWAAPCREVLQAFCPLASTDSRGRTRGPDKQNDSLKMAGRVGGSQWLASIGKPGPRCFLPCPLSSDPSRVLGFRAVFLEFPN